MSAPIDFDDIQVRDTVTRDLEGIASTLTVERCDSWRVYSNWRAPLGNRPGSAWTLVSRPKPAIVLPTTPTLGWATVDQPFRETPLTVLRTYMQDTDALLAEANPYFAVADVTAFVAATAVPTEALDKLRFAHLFPLSEVETFLAAVDAANRQSA